MKQRSIQVGPAVFVIALAAAVVLMAVYSGGGSETGEKIVITVGHPAFGYQSMQDAWHEVIADFEKAHPNIDVVSVQLDWNKIALMTAAKMLPDIYGSNSFSVFRERLRAEDLTPYIKRDNAEFKYDDFIPELMEDCKLGDQLLMLPHFYNISLLYYNVDMFEREGIDPPNESWTWDDLIAASKKLAKYDESGKQIRWGVDITWGWWSQWLTYVTQSGGELFNDDWTRVLLDSPEAIAGLQAYRDLVLKHNAAPPLRKRLLNPFLNEQTAMLWGGHTKNWIAFRSHVPFRWNIALLPAGPATRTGGERVSATFCMYRHSKHKEEAWKLLKWITSPQAGAKWCEVGLTPVRQSVVHDAFLKREADGRFAQSPQDREVALEALRYGVNQPIMPDFSEVVLNFYQPLIDSMMRGEITAEQAATEGTDRANKFLRMLGRSREALAQETGI